MAVYGIVSSNVFSNPLNRDNRWNTSYCLLLTLLEGEESSGADMLQLYLRHRSLAFPDPGAVPSAALQNHLRHLFDCAYEKGMQRLMHHLASGQTWGIEYVELSEQNKRNLKILYTELLDVYRTHVTDLLTNLEMKNKHIQELQKILSYEQSDNTK